MLTDLLVVIRLPAGEPLFAPGVTIPVMTSNSYFPDGYPRMSAASDPLRFAGPFTAQDGRLHSPEPIVVLMFPCFTISLADKNCGVGAAEATTTHSNDDVNCTMGRGSDRSE